MSNISKTINKIFRREYDGYRLPHDRLLDLEVQHYWLEDINDTDTDIVYSEDNSLEEYSATYNLLWDEVE